MGELEVGLLDAVLGFARARADKLVSDVAPSPSALLQALLGHAPTQTQLTALQAKEAEVQGHVAQAATRFASFGANVSAPPATVAAAGQAVGELAAGLAELDAAVQVVAGVVPEVGAAETALVKVVKDASARAGEALGGLAGQLGLLPTGTKVSEGFTISGSRLKYTVANAAERSLAGAAGASVTLKRSGLDAWLDYGAAPILGLTLTTGVRAGLALDGLVAQLAAGASAQVDVDVVATVDSANGVTFGAGTKHRISLPGQLSIPGLELRDLGLELPETGELASSGSTTPGFDITGTLAGQLGVIGAVVEGSGVRVVVDPAKLRSGQPPVSIAPRLPVGVGIKVSAGPVVGGGYLYHKGTEYGGALDLRLGPIEIKAVGLIQTDPFSLVLVLAVEFFPAIQLSFGFTLNGVGGLLALERRLAVDALSAGLRNHVADTILFPKDPVGSAPTILDMLREIFPPQSGGFVVGPMLELGWGVPVSFVTAKVGVVIALPDPKIVLIGALRVAVPVPELPIVDLRAEVLIEISPEELLALVSLSDSRVAGFAVTGDMGLLIRFGSDPDFALSAGGFYPSYRPPGELAGMRRIGVDLSPPAFLTLRAEAYLALTTNSFQLGARVDLRARVGPIGAEGYIAFDAIVVWAPKFAFQADLSAGVSLLALGESFAGVDLHLHVEGPGPWLARGSASISLLFIDVDLDIPTISWGSGDNPAPAAVSPVDLVAEALGKDAAWAAQLPPDVDMLVQFIDDSGSLLLVHPLGAFELRQRAVPLETTIDRVGRNPAAPRRVNLGQPKVGALDAKAVSHAVDDFAPGQYLDLTDDQKLSRPAFEPFPSGLRLAGADAEVHGTPVVTAYEWYTVYPGEDLEGSKRAMFFADHAKASIMASGAAGKFAAARSPYLEDASPVTLADAGAAAIRRVRDLGTDPSVAGAFTTTTEAARALDDLQESSPELAASLQLVAAGTAP